MAEPNLRAAINEEEIFERVLSLPASEQMAALRAACEGYPAVFVRLEGMLASLDGGGFMGNPAARTVSVEVEAELARLKPEEGGERIGNYKLFQRIGEGGFGVVWMAEQEQPIRRRVALKIIKLGMDTKEVIARFEQERQALAMMDHPNIARVLDAGATPFGRPFFVMELVKGVKITEFCDQAKLSTADRLGLFMQVCNAIQHAHQKGIIHRDLKPSNILVALHDGAAVPKVIDFGVAKATQQQRLTDLTLFTQVEQMVGTPLYMSPEQAELSGLDIDTRSDIYSLGVLLYELLTGRTPFDPEELMRQGLDEIRRVIREQEPQKPSTFLSTMALEARTTSAHRRQTDSAKWIGQICGDLDWIVMKSLEKDRTRRYETANGLAKDIERHLLNEPVQARPPTQLYRFRRFARRNKALIAAGSAVLGALLVGLGVSTWMFFKEKDAREAQSRERKKAEAEASKSHQVAQFFTDMLNGVGPSAALGRDTQMLREVLDKTAERIGKDLKNQPAVEADLRRIIGNVYRELGDYEKAAAMHREALNLRRELHGDEHPNVAQSLQNLAVVLLVQGKLVEAETMHREALAMYRKLLGNQNAEVALSLNGWARALLAEGKPVEAETLHREALALQRQLLGDEDPTVAESLTDVARALIAQGKLAEAETMGRDALALTRKLLGNEHPKLVSALNLLALVLKEQRKFADAETMIREALALTRRLVGNEHLSVAESLGNLAVVLERQEKLWESETLHREVLAMNRKLLGNDHPRVASALTDLATLIHRRKTSRADYPSPSELAEPEAMHREALAIRRRVLGDEHPDVAASFRNVASSLEQQRRIGEAEIVYREALVVNRKSFGNEHAEVARSLGLLASVVSRQGRLAEAETFCREALVMQRKLLGSEHPEAGYSLVSLGSILLSQRKNAEAETICREALAIQRRLYGNEHPNVVSLLNQLIYLARVQGDSAGEVRLREELAQSIKTRRAASGNHELAAAKSLVDLANIRFHQNKPDEAERIWRDALVIERNLLGNEHLYLAGSLGRLGAFLVNNNKLAEAEPLYREALAIQRKLLGNEHPEIIAGSLDSLGSLLSNQDKLAEAEAAYREALAITRKVFGNENPKVAASLHRLAHALEKQANLSEAQSMIREALAIQRKSADENDPEVAKIRVCLGKMLAKEGKSLEIERYREALAAQRKLLGNDNPDLVIALNSLADELRDHGELAEVDSLRREALALVRRFAKNDAKQLESSLNLLAENLFREGHYAVAEPLYRELLASRQTSLQANDEKVVSATSSLAHVLTDWAWSEHLAIAEVRKTDPEIASRAREAEQLMRNCLMTQATNGRATGEAKSHLGGALVAVAATDPNLTNQDRAAKLAEAESLLLDNNELPQQGENVDTRYKADSLTHLVRLYQTWQWNDFHPN